MNKNSDCHLIENELHACTKLMNQNCVCLDLQTFMFRDKSAQFPGRKCLVESQTYIKIIKQLKRNCKFKFNEIAINIDHICTHMIREKKT